MDYKDFLGKVNTAYKPKPALSSDVAGISVEYCIEVLEGGNESLVDAFHWRSTPQGSIYWAERCDGVVDMTHEDYEFVRSLIT